MPLTRDEFDAMFPAVMAKVEATIAEDALIAARVTWHGAHPSAGPYVAGSTMHVFQLDNGLIVAQWSAGWDWLAPHVAHATPHPANPLMVIMP